MVCVHEIRVGINSVCISGHYQHPNQKLIRLFDTSVIRACVQVFMFIWCFWTLFRSSLIKRSVFFAMQYCLRTSTQSIKYQRDSEEKQHNNAYGSVPKSHTNDKRRMKIGFPQRTCKFLWATFRSTKCFVLIEANVMKKRKLNYKHNGM